MDAQIAFCGIVLGLASLLSMAAPFFLPQLFLPQCTICRKALGAHESLNIELISSDEFGVGQMLMCSDCLKRHRPAEAK